MKRFTYALFMFLLLFPRDYIYSQEEFFGDQNGLSLSYLKVFDAQANGIGLSFYSNKGFIVGFGIENINKETYPMASLIVCPSWGENQNDLKFGIGLSYGYVEKHNLVGLNMGLIKCFFPKSNFPFSINGSFSIQTILGGSFEMGIDVTQIFGLGYTQAFFAHRKIYPFIGISNAFEMKEKNYFVSAIAGINFKLGSNTGKD